VCCFTSSVHIILVYIYFLQLMFEQYQFEGVYIAIQAVLTLYAQGMVYVVYSVPVKHSLTAHVSYNRS